MLQNKALTKDERGSGGRMYSLQIKDMESTPGIIKVPLKSHGQEDPKLQVAKDT